MSNDLIFRLLLYCCVYVDNFRVSFVKRLATSDNLLVVFFFLVFFLLAGVLTCLGYHFKYYRYCFYCSSLDMCVCMRVRVCAFVPVIFLLDFCMFYVRMFYGPSWSDLNKYNTIIQLLLEVVYYVGLHSCKKFLLQSYWPCDYNVLFLLSFTGKER